MQKVVYVPVLILRDEEIKRLSTLRDAFLHEEVIPFLEIVRDFLNPVIRPGRIKKDGTIGKSSENDARLLANILLALPKGKAPFVAVYRNLKKCSSSDFSEDYPYLSSLFDVNSYFSESTHLFDFPNVIPVFEVDNHDDLLSASSFVEKAHSLNRSVGLRVNVIDDEETAILGQLLESDYLFLNLGEEDVSTSESSLMNYDESDVKAPLIVIGENHPAALKTKELVDAKNENKKLHCDYFDEIKSFPYVAGAGDYCGVKNVLKQESMRSKIPHPGQANLIIYHHNTKGYRVFVDGKADGARGYANILAQALKNSHEIDSHALGIIRGEKTTGSYARWNVIGAIHYVYDVLQIVV